MLEESDANVGSVLYGVFRLMLSCSGCSLVSGELTLSNCLHLIAAGRFDMFDTIMYRVYNQGCLLF